RSDGGNYIERVDVIGNDKFIEFVEDLEKLEDIKLDTFDVGKDKLQIISIMPLPSEKGEYDIGLPQLTPSLMRKNTLAEEIAAVDVMSFKLSPPPIKPGDTAAQSLKYDGY